MLFLFARRVAFSLLYTMLRIRLSSWLCLCLTFCVTLGYGARPTPVYPRDTEAPDSFVINGDIATNGSWPWQGSLRAADGFTICGCVLVHPTWIMTAAHCVGVAGYSALFGTNTLEESSGQLVRISQIITHPLWGDSGSDTDGAFPYDFALLVPEEDVRVGASVALAEDDTGTDKECWITGWGQSGGGEPSSELLEAQIPVIEDDACANAWGDSFNPLVHICAFAPDDEIGACYTDSGGPLVCDDKLYGLSSWFAAGCNTFYPSVYARIFPEKNWICEITDGSLTGC